MTLAEAVHIIRAVQGRIHRTHADLCQGLHVQEGESKAPGKQLLRELRGLMTRRADTRLGIAAALAEHPEAVEALAEYRVARLRVKLLGGLVLREASPSSTDLMRRILAYRQAQGLGGRRRHPSATTIRKGTPNTTAAELLARQKAAKQRLLAAELRLARLSARIEVLPGHTPR